LASSFLYAYKLFSARTYVHTTPSKEGEKLKMCTGKGTKKKVITMFAKNLKYIKEIVKKNKIK